MISYIPLSVDDFYKVLKIIDNEKCIGFIVIHKKKELPSFGATRVKEYSCKRSALMDALLLAKGMTKKARHTNFPTGGAKVVLFPQKKEYLLTAIKHIAAHNKDIVTGADMGLCQRDIRTLDGENIVGRYVDPVFWTVKGILACMPKMNSILIQGAGKIGKGIIKNLHSKVTIYVSEKNLDVACNIKNEFPKINLIKDITKIKVDVICPCAESGTITDKLANMLNCKYIIGAANNPLVSKNTECILKKRKIIYYPDYIVNAGGLISVYHEYCNTIDSIKEDILKIRSRIEKLNFA